MAQGTVNLGHEFCEQFDGFLSCVKPENLLTTEITRGSTVQGRYCVMELI